MAHLAISHDSCGATVVEAALRLLLISVCRRFRETGEPGAKGYAKYLEFLEIVERNYLKAMSIETYAKNLGVSSKTLSRHVREAASCSPSHVVAERIALEMKRLLVHSDLSVKEISAQLGMDDASYATRFFRKHCGLAPSAFRESWRWPNCRLRGAPNGHLTSHIVMNVRSVLASSAIGRVLTAALGAILLCKRNTTDRFLNRTHYPFIKTFRTHSK